MIYLLIYLLGMLLTPVIGGRLGKNWDEFDVLSVALAWPIALVMLVLHTIYKATRR